jgi:hypothetical protein
MIEIKKRKKVALMYTVGFNRLRINHVKDKDKGNTFIDNTSSMLYKMIKMYSVIVMFCH